MSQDKSPYNKRSGHKKIYYVLSTDSDSHLINQPEDEPLLEPDPNVSSFAVSAENVASVTAPELVISPPNAFSNIWGATDISDISDISNAIQNNICQPIVDSHGNANGDSTVLSDTGQFDHEECVQEEGSAVEESAQNFKSKKHRLVSDDDQEDTKGNSTFMQRLYSIYAKFKSRNTTISFFMLTTVFLILISMLLLVIQFFPESLPPRLAKFIPDVFGLIHLPKNVAFVEVVAVLSAREVTSVLKSPCSYLTNTSRELHTLSLPPFIINNQQIPLNYYSGQVPIYALPGSILAYDMMLITNLTQQVENKAKPEDRAQLIITGNTAIFHQNGTPIEVFPSVTFNVPLNELRTVNIPINKTGLYYVNLRTFTEVNVSCNISANLVVYSDKNLVFVANLTRSHNSTSVDVQYGADTCILIKPAHPIISNVMLKSISYNLSTSVWTNFLVYFYIFICAIFLFLPIFVCSCFIYKNVK